MPKLKLPKLNLVFEVPESTNLMDFLLSKNIPVASSCGGEGICGKCLMKIKSKTSDVSYPNEQEELKLTQLGTPGQRLSCQVIIFGDIEAETNYW